MVTLGGILRAIIVGRVVMDKESQEHAANVTKWDIMQGNVAAHLPVTFARS